jgi:DNA-binding CsgD family transcriptional regulator
MSSGTGRTPELLDLLASGCPPAFATDSRDRIVFCNSGAAEILGRRADDLLGRRCYEAVEGRDVFGNRFCYANCAVRAGLRAHDELSAFDLDVCGNGGKPRSVGVTIFRIPSLRPDLFTLVHVLQPIAENSRLAWLLSRPGVTNTLQAPGPAEPLGAAAAEPAPALTAREREVLREIASGRQNKEIAARMGLSTATVRNHVHHILEKLQVHSKLEAVSLAFRLGWVARDAGAAVPRRQRTGPGSPAKE